ncbi:RICIN domain-containing protein [Asanoa sp. WMMD1127]|uniref:ricin-type beta-trefoil lectin domain protein n=1 Tax=Asanoa sp. WMMD1127 TaxID=3016107 RepID=UPI0024173BE8|nr:RICIN domain-containing protein [Asanoa sp. WMMD1127]MDG4825614.1 RICIN domain-containing protein [Asanoa sp. WMMD1127]
MPLRPIIARTAALGGLVAALLTGSPAHAAAPRDQVPLVDAATVVRSAAEALGGAGLASVVIEERTVAVFWKGDLPPAVRAAVARARSIAPVRVAAAKYSKAELLDASARIEAQLAADPGFHGIKARPDGSGLVVKVDASGARTLAATGGVPVTFSVEERLRPVARNNDSAPWSGGAQIINTSIGAGCTGGYGVNTPSGPAILSAGHCGQPGNRITDGGGEFIGNIGGDDNTYDVLVIPTSTVSNRMYVGGGASNQQLTVTGGGAPFVGERLCQSGNTSANAVGGQICNLQVRFEGTDSQRLWEATQTDGQIAARPGDSGGPVYLDRGDGTVTARGTTTRVAGSGFGFAGFEKAQQRFGVSIPGGSGGGRTGQVVGATSGKCLDINAGATADGTKIQIWTCNGTTAQRWTIGADGTVRGLGKCLDVRSSGTANGTIVQLWGCNGTGAQVWAAGANGSLVNPRSGRCLDVAGNGTADGTQIQLWDCNGTGAQRWTLPA